MAALNNIIILNRGDTYEFDLTIDDANSLDGRYHIQGDDVVYFGIMDPHQPFEEALVKKRFTIDDTDASGNLMVVIEPEDTLDLLPGTYYYAVKIHLQHDNIHPETNEVLGYVDKVFTVIQKTKLFLND
jgi:hypothetical protein